MGLFKGKYLPIYCGIIVLIADFLSKHYTHEYLPVMRHYLLWYPYGGIGVFENFFGIEFSISHQINHGAAWGILADYQQPLLYMRIILIVFLVFYAIFFTKNKSWHIPLALIIAGAIGNVVDYFIYGHVVDMFHFVLWGYDFPVFNVADSAICIGIFSLITLSFFSKKKAGRK